MANGYNLTHNNWQIEPVTSCSVMEVDQTRPGKRKLGCSDGPVDFAGGVSSVVSSCSSTSTCPSPMSVCEDDDKKLMKRARTGDAPESAHRNPYEVINAMLRSANIDKQRRAEEAAEIERLRVQQYWAHRNHWLQQNVGFHGSRHDDGGVQMRIAALKEPPIIEIFCRRDRGARFKTIRRRHYRQQKRKAKERQQESTEARKRLLDKSAMSSAVSTSVNSSAIEGSKVLHTIEGKTEGIPLGVLQRELHNSRKREAKMIQEIERLEEKCAKLEDTARSLNGEIRESRRQCEAREVELKGSRGELEETRRKLVEAEQRMARCRAEKFKIEREVQDIHWASSKRDHKFDTRIENMRTTIGSLKCAYQSAFAMNEENENLCTCLQLRLKTKSDQVASLQQQNVRLRQALNSRIADLMEEHTTRSDDSADTDRSVRELTRENALMKSRLQYLARLLKTDGHTDVDVARVDEAVYNRIVSELRTLEVVKSDQDAEISRLVSEIARLRDISNSFGLTVGAGANEKFRSLESESSVQERRKARAGKKAARSRRRRGISAADCVTQ
ncbi:hypothetical protein FOL47_004714 [Perkinsus chesapeaki]|uniref:Uncharacterized protein n=1 Tax=Perkinsus chesapeaki TaxID=330153 RepID=A0A7J6M1A9_PERCH|nr:hypothetical protein FOL47_004714 [Perkinsus chesapeaki]